jgi:hypothetical protein
MAATNCPVRREGGIERRGKSHQERPHHHRDGADEKEGARKQCDKPVWR